MFGDAGRVLAPLGARGMTMAATIARAETGGDWLAATEAWREAGDALAAIGRADRAPDAWERGIAAAERTGTRRPLAALYWRLGQVAEAGRELAAADAWYEKAADLFHAEGAAADEAEGRMALARVRFHHEGAGMARAAARDAVLAAKAADDLGLLALAMELMSAIAFDLGDHVDAASSAREAARAFTDLHDDAGVVRARVLLAEALLDDRQTLAAVQAFEPLEAVLDGVEDPEMRGRGLALMARFLMGSGSMDEGADLHLKAQQYLEAAGATMRRARLYVEIGRILEARADDPKAGVEVYAKAWELARKLQDRFRTAPIAYSFARCLVACQEHIRADEIIIEALRLTQEAGDLEGLAHATDLGMRIALMLHQGPLALERMLLLARTRERMGDHLAATRTLLMALEATYKVPGLESGPLADELIESVRRSGIDVLGPDEALKVAARLAAFGKPGYAAELAAIEGVRQLDAAQRSAAARAFAKAARWAAQAGQSDDALAHLERAIALGEPLRLREVDEWRADRTVLLDQ